MEWAIGTGSSFPRRSQSHRRCSHRTAAPSTSRSRVSCIARQSWGFSHPAIGTTSTFILRFWSCSSAISVAFTPSPWIWSFSTWVTGSSARCSTSPFWGRCSWPGTLSCAGGSSASKGQSWTSWCLSSWPASLFSGSCFCCPQRPWYAPQSSCLYLRSTSGASVPTLYSAWSVWTKDWTWDDSVPIGFCS